MYRNTRLCRVFKMYSVKELYQTARARTRVRWNVVPKRLLLSNHTARASTLLRLLSAQARHRGSIPARPS